MTAAILAVRPAIVPGQFLATRATTDFVRRCALAQPHVSPQHFVCRWQHEADGRLNCIWEPDVVPARRR